MIPEKSAILPWIIYLPLIGAIINGVFGKKMSKSTVTMIAVGAPVAAFVLALGVFVQLMGMNAPEGTSPYVYTHLWNWVATDWLTIDVEFMVDRLSAVMLLVVTGVGSLIHIFSIGYMWGDKAYWRYFSYLNLFMFSMLLLILGKNLIVLFVGWEGVGVCSYLLIGFWYQDMDKATAGQKAFIANRVGDFAVLIGMFILMYYSGGDVDFVRLEGLFTGNGVLNPDSTTGAIAGRREMTVTLIAILFFIGCTGKSAQIPLYVWLPDAMAGPTPVSALIHAATMVTAGVYLMCRMSYMYAVSEVAMTVVAVVGAMTALFAATMALVQNDIKKVLAYSTVSQLGFMVLAVGVGGFVAAVFHLMTHAFFKACLFLGSGSVIHAMHHEQDIRNMGGLKKKLPVTARTFFWSCLAIAGIPLFSGFFSKDEIMFRVFTNEGAAAGGYVLWGIAAVAAFCTAFYMFRLYYLTFEGEYRGDPHVLDHAHEEKVMNIPLLVLGGLAVVGGFLGIPHVVGHFHVLEGWLEPTFASAMSHVNESNNHSLEWILIGVSVAIAVGGWQLARKMYNVPSREDLPVAPVNAAWHRTLMNKYWVDELYDMLFVRTLVNGSRWLYRNFDKKIIDGVLVHGTARLFGLLGDGLRRLQTGSVQTYVTAVVVGIAVLLAFVSLQGGL